MIGQKIWSGLAVVGALAVSAGLASASAPTRHAKPANATAAVHTATAVTHHRTKHVHHRPVPVIAANHAPAPAAEAPPERPAPPRQRPNRATLPALAQINPHAPASRYGPRHAPAALSELATRTIDARSLEARNEANLDPRILTVSGGRGPPRGSPSGPSRGRATPAPASAEDPDAWSSASAITVFAAPSQLSAPQRPFPRTGDIRPLAAAQGASPVSEVETEAGSGRLHADRSEGASACSSMPSNGGTPCPASSPSRR